MPEEYRAAPRAPFRSDGSCLPRRRAPTSGLRCAFDHGDGGVDTLLLVATGTRAESLQVRFRIRSAGKVVYEATWPSELYFAYDAPVESIPGPRLRAVVLRHLDQFLEPDAFGRLSAADSAAALEILPYEVCGDSLATASRCPSDLVTQAWRGVLASARRTFTVFSGGEHTRTIAWSRRAQRFYVVFSCC